METIVAPKFSTLKIAERLSALEEKMSERNGETQPASKKREKDEQSEVRAAKEESAESLLLGNMPLQQEPVIRALADLFGSPIHELTNKDVELLAEIVKMSEAQVGAANLGKVWKHISTMMHQAPGGQKLRTVYRLLSLGLSNTNDKEKKNRGDE